MSRALRAGDAAPPPMSAPAPPPPGPSEAAAVAWTPAKVLLSLFLFLAAGVAEVAGGWLVWQAVRERRSWWLGLAGCLLLVLYGFIPTFQPSSNFGRVYAAYGGFFIVLSYLWGWALDGVRPDVGDWVGAGVALGGCALAYFWPR
jgi:small multidrug resistance family-3 protein